MYLFIYFPIHWRRGGGAYEMYRSEPPGCDPDELASLWGLVIVHF